MKQMQSVDTESFAHIVPDKRKSWEFKSKSRRKAESRLKSKSLVMRIVEEERAKIAAEKSLVTAVRVKAALGLPAGTPMHKNADGSFYVQPREKGRFGKRIQLV
jgi:hypothetical protein